MRQLHPHQVRQLGGGPHVQGPDAGRVAGHHGTALHGQAGHPTDGEAVPHHHVGPGERRLHVALLPGVGHQEIRAKLRVQHRRVGLQGPFGVDHVGQRVVVHGDRPEGVLGHVPVGGHHRDHRLPLEQRPVPGHRVERHCRDVGEGAEHRDGLGPAQDLLAQHDRVHPREPGRLADVDLRDARVRIRAPPHRHVEHPR